MAKTKVNICRLDPLTPPQMGILRKWEDPSIQYLVVSCGRQVGKSHTAIVIAARTALQPPSKKAAHIGYFMPYINGAKIQYRRLFNMLAGKIVGMVSNDTNRQLTFLNGSTITFFGADNPTAIRGNTFDYIIVDEACFVDGNTWSEAILATVSIAISKGHGKILLCSTPKEKNWFYDYFMTKKHNYHSIKFTSAESGLHSEEALEEIRSKTPAAIFQNEYEAEFQDGSRGIFELTRSLFAQQTVPEKDFVKGTVAAVDWGMENDYTVLSIISGSRQVIHVARWRKIPWFEVIANIVSTLNRFGRPLVYAETNGIGSMPTQALRAAFGSTNDWVTTQESKASAIMKLAEDLISPKTRLILPDIDWVKEEFENFGFEYANGKIKFGNMKHDIHDDSVMSIAIANYNWRGFAKFM